MEVNTEFTTWQSHYFYFLKVFSLKNTRKSQNFYVKWHEQTNGPH